jgi:hypothetical protein
MWAEWAAEVRIAVRMVCMDAGSVDVKAGSR